MPIFYKNMPAIARLTQLSDQLVGASCKEHITVTTQKDMRKKPTQPPNLLASSDAAPQKKIHKAFGLSTHVESSAPMHY